MRTTIDLPDTLFREIEARAETQGVSAKALIPRLVKAGLERDRPGRVSARRKRSRLPIIRKANTGKPLPVLSAGEIHQIELDEDVAKHARSARR